VAMCRFWMATCCDFCRKFPFPDPQLSPTEDGTQYQTLVTVISLSCHHSLCLNCLKLLNYLQTFHAFLSIFCPICDEDITQDLKSLCDLHEISTWETHLKQSVKLLLCEHCEDNQVSIFCCTCQINLCDHCWKNIHSSKIMQKHEKSFQIPSPDSDKSTPATRPWDLLTSITSSSAIAQISDKSTEEKCPIHSEEFLNYFCHDCQMKICENCSKNSHQNHTSQLHEEFLDDIKRNLFENLMTSIEYFHQMQETLQISSTLLSSSSSWKTDLLTELISHCNSLYRQLENRRQTLLSLAESLAESRYQILTKQRSTLTNIHLNSLQILEKVHRYLPTLSSLEDTDNQQQQQQQWDETRSKEQRDQTSTAAYVSLLREIQSVLAVDVTENIGSVHDDRDISFQYSSSLPELLYTYGEITTDDEPWLLLSEDDTETFSSSLQRSCSKEISPVDIFTTPMKSFPSPSSSSPSSSCQSHTQQQQQQQQQQQEREIEYQQRRSTLCSLVDQVEAIINQTNSMNRHIELIMTGIGYQPQKDVRQQQIGELRRSLTSDQTSISQNQSLLNQKDLITPSLLSSSLAFPSTPKVSPLKLSSLRLEEENEISDSDPFDDSPRDLTVNTAAPAAAAGPPAEEAILSRGIHRIGMNALSSTKCDINEHFEYLSRILLLRFEHLKMSTQTFLQRKDSYLHRTHPLILTSRSKLFSHILSLLQHLRQPLSTFQSFLSHTTQLLRQTPPLTTQHQRYEQFRHSVVSATQHHPPLSILYNITSFITDHGTVGGPPSPIDLTVKRTHNGHGTGIELTWRDGPKVKSEEDGMNTIDYYIIQSAVYQCSPSSSSSSSSSFSSSSLSSPSSSSPSSSLSPLTSARKGNGKGKAWPSSQYTLLQPYQDITHLSHDLYSCIIDIRDHPNSLLLFRIQSVSLTGISGPYSMSISITTPPYFTPIFEYSGSPFDRNGLLYWIGTQSGKSKSYQNPALLKEITVTSSTLQGSLHLFVNHTHAVAMESSTGTYIASASPTSTSTNTGTSTGTTLCMTHNKAQSWFSLDLGKDRYLQVHAYCLRSGRGENYKLRNWELHGKVEKSDKKWHILKRHRNCLDLKETSYSTAAWDVPTVFSSPSHSSLSSSSTSFGDTTVAVISDSSQPQPQRKTTLVSGSVSGNAKRMKGVRSNSSSNSSPSASSTAPLVMDSMEPPSSPIFPSSSSASHDSSSASPSASPQPLAYRYFRIIQTGLNSSGDHHLVCNGLELYGILFHVPPSSSPAPAATASVHPSGHS
jgi:hypothetical protein